MKILVLGAATGGGHLRAAHAIEETIRQNTDEEVVNLDALKAIGKLFDRVICGSYLFMAKRTPAFFGRLYRQSNSDHGFGNVVSGTTELFARELGKTIARENPDVIITTHPFAATMVGQLKHKGKLDDTVFFSLITDYGVHRAYLADNRADGYIVACEDMVEEMERWGIPREKVHPFGIPVHQVFFEHPPKAQQRESLGLKPDLDTILFMAGSFGVSNIMGLYRDLKESRLPLQAIIITGKNESLYARFQEEIGPQEEMPTQLLMFTDRVQDYMHAADLLVTKPGGLTVSEALACSLPLAAFDAIPGQEEDNAAFLERHGMALRLKPDSDFSGEITALFKDRARLAAMEEACAGFDKSRCVEQILALSRELLGK